MQTPYTPGTSLPSHPISAIAAVSHCSRSSSRVGHYSALLCSALLACWQRCWLLTRTRVPPCRRPAATSFVQDLFGLVVQAPCPVDYQDSANGASAGAPAGAPASAAANGTASAANSDEAKAQGRPEAADDGQAWRRQPVTPQAPSARPNGQVSGFRSISNFDTATARLYMRCQVVLEATSGFCVISLCSVCGARASYVIVATSGTFGPCCIPVPRAWLHFMVAVSLHHAASSLRTLSRDGMFCAQVSGGGKAGAGGFSATEVLQYTKYFQLVPAQGLRVGYDNMVGSFEAILREVWR